MTTAINIPHESMAPATYEEALAFMRHLFDEIQAGRPVAGAGVFAVVDRLLLAFDADVRTLMGLTAQTPTSYPMASHAVNTAIMAIATAKGLEHGLPHVRDVGAAALLHDIGLVQLVEQGATKGVAFADIKRHPRHAVEMLEQIPELARLTVYLTPLATATPVHEQPQPSLSAPRTTQPSSREAELRKVIRLADLYEALSHPRADGQPLAFAAVRTILTAHQLFEPRLIKALFDQVGIYPLGTWAQLSSGEIGLVTGIHPGMPLRPTVTVFYDRDSLKAVEPREVSLSEQPSLFIRRSLTREPQPRA